MKSGEFIKGGREACMVGSGRWRRGAGHRKWGYQVIDPVSVSGAQECTHTAFNNKTKEQKNTLMAI